MSDADSKLTILIESVLNATGFKMTEEQAQRVKQATKEMDEEAQKGQEKLFESHRENREILRELANQTIPGAGRALSALALGPTGAVIALVTAVGELKEIIEKSTEKIYDMQSAVTGRWLNDFVKALSDAAQQARDLEEALRKAKQTSDDYENKRAEKSIQALVKALHGGEDVESAALTTARQVELTQRQGGQSALEAAAAARETPAKVIKSRKERASELAAQQSALDKATADLNTKENDDLKDEIDNKKTALDEHRKMVESGDIRFKIFGPDPLGFVKQEQEAMERLESQTAESRKAAATQRINELSAQVLQDEKNAAEEKSVYDDAKEKATSNAKRVTELKQQIQEAQDAAMIKSETAAKQLLSLLPLIDTKTAEKVAGLNTPGGAGSFVQQFLASQGRLASGHGTAGDSDMIRLMNEMLQRTQASDRQMMELLQAIIAHKGDFEAALRDLQNKIQRRVEGMR